MATTAERESARISGVGSTDIITVTLSLDTSIYADGDVLAATQEIANAARAPSGRAILQSIHVLDEDDQGVAFDVIFLGADVAIGTENAAPSITDADARQILGMVRVGAGDYIDLGGCRIATLTGLGLPLEPAAGATSLYLGAITRGGTPTYTAAGVSLRLGILWD